MDWAVVAARRGTQKPAFWGRRAIFRGDGEAGGGRAGLAGPLAWLGEGKVGRRARAVRATPVTNPLLPSVACLSV